MSHGGRRDGAGRKRLLDDEFDQRRTWIGGRCEYYAVEVSQRNAHRLAERRGRKLASRANIPNAFDALQEDLAELATLSRNERAVAARYLQQVPEPEDDLPPGLDTITDRVLDNRARLTVLGQGTIVPGKRPKGYRRAVIRRVALEASEKFNQALTERFVEQCWKDYRRELRDLKD